MMRRSHQGIPRPLGRYIGRSGRAESSLEVPADGREGAWFKDSEGNLVGIISALAR